MKIVKYPRTPHLEGSGIQRGDDPALVPDRALAARSDTTWVVEEKVDGANAAISFDEAGELHLQSRGHYLDVDGRPPRERHFGPLKTWARMHERALLERLEDRHVVYGEWLGALHTQFYDALPSLFLEFDVLDRVHGTFLSTPARDRLLVGLPLPAVPVLHAGQFVDRAARDALVRPSLFRSDTWRDSLDEQIARGGARRERVLEQVETTRLAEGLYVKGERGSAVEERFKYVRADFVQRITDNDTHWHERPIVRNVCAPGIEFLDPESVAPRVDRYAERAPADDGKSTR